MARGPTQPRHVFNPTWDQVGTFGAEFGGYMVPGTGLLDAGGRYAALTDPEQAYYPGLLENLRSGNYGTAAGQAMGLLGDGLSFAGPIGLAAGMVAKAPRAAATAGKAAKAAKAAGKATRADDVASAWRSRGLKADVSEQADVITLSRIEVPAEQRGQGAGTQAMQELMDYADATGKRIALSPSSDFGGAKRRLENFYQRLGFRANKGRSRDPGVSETMIREPKIVGRGPDLGAAYRGQHTAPGHGYGAPMHDVTRDIYPDDFYGPMGLRYYGTGDATRDQRAYDVIQKVRGKPDELVDVWRAVPKDTPAGSKINPGDWVTPARGYAVDHGDSVFGRGNYKIIKSRKPAGELMTDGNSLLEWGWAPTHPGYRADMPPQGLLGQRTRQPQGLLPDS